MEFSENIIPVSIRRDFDDAVSSGSDIVVRFPPEPSGYMHLGHLKALYINACIAAIYMGRLIVRMDDTNPVTESYDFVQGLITDINRFVNPHSYTLTYTSDYFDILLNYAERLINIGVAYVDVSTPEDIKRSRSSESDHKETVYRSNDIETNLNMWQKLKTGELSGCLRLKVDLNHKNTAMRDPTMYRTNIIAHYKTGNTYKIYPTYDFACSVVDSLEGVTHIFRSNEFNERDDIMKFILTSLNLRIPKCYHYGRINIDGAELSKRKIKQSILDGEYSGWDDIRLYTIRGLLNRGISIRSMEAIMIDTGYPESHCILDQKKIITINKKTVDSISTRYVALEGELVSVEFVLSGEDVGKINVPGTKLIDRFTRNPSLGSRIINYASTISVEKNDMVNLKDGEEVTLMNTGNAYYTGGRFVSHLDGDFKKTKNKIIWIANLQTDAPIMKVKYITLDNKISTVDYTVEHSALNEVPGCYVQLYRKTYYMITGVHDNIIEAVSLEFRP